MFNTSNHSCERSSRQTQQRRESSQSQRASNTLRSRSGHSSPSSSRRSDSRAQWHPPVWVHCEECYGTSGINSDLVLFSCLHIFCKRCLRIEKSSIPTDALPCLICKAQLSHRLLDSSLNQDKGLPAEWMERYNKVKKIVEHSQKLRNLENEITEKSNLTKSEIMKNYKTVKTLRSLYEQRKKSENRQPEKRQQTVRGNYEKDMKFVSSGRNEHSNQYISQLKSSHRPTNQNQSAANIPSYQNQSAANIQSFSQRTVPQTAQRPVSNPYRLQLPTKETDSRPIIQPATFRPKTRDFKADNHQFEPIRHAQKRLAPSYNYDEYTNPSKRATNYPIRRELNLDTSNTSSGGSSLRLNDSRFNPHAKSLGSSKYSNRHENSSRNPKFL